MTCRPVPGWFLLATLELKARQDAEGVLDRYRLRWRIEDCHRVVKSGCNVEYPGASHGESDRVCGDDHCGHRPAAHGDDADGPGHAGTASRDPVLRHRDHGAERFRQGQEAARTRKSRVQGADDSDPVQLPEPQERCATGPSEDREVYTRRAVSAQTYERLMRLQRTSDLYRRLRSK